MKDVSKYLNKSWEHYLHYMHHTIPAFKIKIHNGDTSEIIYLKKLKYFANGVPLKENKPVYTNDTVNVPLTPMDTTTNFNIKNISEIDIASGHINDTCSISSVADIISIPTTGTPSQSNNTLVNKILFSPLASKKNSPPVRTRHNTKV